VTTELPERQLRDLAGARTNVTVATAESCTGGNVASRIVSIDGSSAYFLGGIVAYANDVKHRLLGVPEDILANPGAVSEETAIAMAEGARRAIGTTFAISTTGIAGPGGGTARKPVGLVYIGLSGPNGTFAEEHVFPGNRGDIIHAATQRALDLLVQAINTSS
jgi:nicotinamide-nucleotide amidase